jgi:phosphoserine phosphatase
MNQTVINGLPGKVLERYLPTYAVGAKYRLDQRLLRPLKKVREQHGLLLGIISSGCDIAIMQTLKAAGYPFDFVKANCFHQNGSRVEAFTLEIYDNKSEVLKTVLAEREIESSSVMYIGDDWQDQECLRAVRFPVVSFFAHPDTRICLKKELNVYAPETEENFEQYLQKALA